MRQVTVRPADIGDADDAARLLGQLGYPADAAEVARRMALLAQDPMIETLVAELDGRVVGLATLHQLQVINRPGPVMQLTALVVDDTVRQQGVGRILVRAVVERGKARGCERLSVTTHIDREAAHRFYSRAGFAHTGTRFGMLLRDEVLPSGGSE
jgi:GNAT superfamily N-acetyltransferase